MSPLVPLLAVLAIALAAPSAASAQVPDAWLGTWTLNVEQSSYTAGSSPYRRGTLTVERWEDGVRLTSNLVRTRGGVVHTEWTGRFDGQDYPVQGIDDYLTYAYRPLDDRTTEVLVKADGRIVGRSRITLSRDGKTLTTVTAGTNARGEAISTTTIYAKR